MTSGGGKGVKDSVCLWRGGWGFGEPDSQLSSCFFFHTWDVQAVTESNSQLRLRPQRRDLITGLTDG